MLKRCWQKFISFVENSRGGLTLVELIVTIAILAIASSVLVSSYTNVMEKQRMRADMSILNNIDTSLEQILLYDDVFEQIKEKNWLHDENMLTLIFKVKTDDEGRGCIYLEDTTINGEDHPLVGNCDLLYQCLVDYVGEDEDGVIYLSSASYKNGFYQVDIEFNKTTVSTVRGDPTINNDVIIITNSGDTNLYRQK